MLRAQAMISAVLDALNEQVRWRWPLGRARALRAAFAAPRRGESAADNGDPEHH